MTNFMNKSLMVKLTVILLVIALVPIVILGIMSYMSSKAALVKQITQDFDAISQGKEQAIMEQLHANQIECLVHSRSSVISNALEKVNSKAIDAQETADNLSKYLKERMDVNPLATELFVIDKDGKITSSTDEKHIGIDRAKDDYFLNGQKGLYIKDIYRSDITGKVGYAIAAPVKNPKTGEFLGIFVQRLDLGGLNRILADRTGLGETGENYLVNKYSVMITESRTIKDAILNQKVDAQPLRYFHEKGKNMAGVYTDYRGNKVLGATSGELLQADPITKPLEWVVISEMEEVEAFAPVTKLGLRIILVGILIALIVIIVALILARGIAKPIKEVSESIVRIGDGDLTQEIKETKAQDEVGLLTNAAKKMRDNLREMVTQVFSTAERVSTSSQELSSSAQEMNATTQEVSSTVQQIAKGSESTASRVEETSKVIEQMSASVSQVATSAQQAATASLQASQSAQKGGDSAQEAVNKMNKIYESISSSAVVVKKLGERSEQINDIVSVITEIADQTNLLALNAAIEAARAGEQGRGFAVVAEEVRKLAEGSGKAADQISKLIKDIQKETNQAVLSMDNGSREVAEGREVVTKAGGALTEIVKVVENTASMVEQISAASQQMSAGTKQVVRSVDEIASTAQEAASATQEASASTQEMTASMQQMAASAQELSEMAINLRDLVAKFKVDQNQDRGYMKPQTVASSHKIALAEKMHLDRDKLESIRKKMQDKRHHKDDEDKKKG